MTNQEQPEPEKCPHGRPKGTCMECWKAENPDKM